MPSRQKGRGAKATRRSCHASNAKSPRTVSSRSSLAARAPTFWSALRPRKPRPFHTHHRSHSGVFMAARLTTGERKVGRSREGGPSPTFLTRRRGAARSEPILDLVGPVSLEAQQRGIHPNEVVARDAADLFDRTRMLLIDPSDDAVDLFAPLGQADPNRAAVDARAGMMEEADLDQLLDVIGNIRAEIIAACAQFAGGQFLVADIIQEQCLYRVDVGSPAAVELILDNVQQSTMKPFDHRQSL